MFFSKSCEYALRATMYIAQSPEGQKVGVHMIAEDLKVPVHYLSKVLQVLVKNNIISSAKGRNGGFFLGPHEINNPLISIVHAIDGKDVFLNCALGMSHCSKERPCPLHDDITAYRDNLQRVLSQSTIGSTVKAVESGETFLAR